MTGTSCTGGPAEEPGWDITGEMVIRKAEGGMVAATSGTLGTQAEAKDAGSVRRRLIDVTTPEMRRKIW